MKSLIVEDDFTSRLILQKLLEPYSECHIAVNSDEALQAFTTAMEGKSPYDLICLDIMMPGMDGQNLLVKLRQMEKDAQIPLGRGAKIVMTTALGDKDNVLEAFRGNCDAYLIKPFDRAKFLEIIRNLRFIK